MITRHFRHSEKVQLIETQLRIFPGHAPEETIQELIRAIQGLHTAMGGHPFAVSHDSLTTEIILTPTEPKLDHAVDEWFVKRMEQIMAKLP
jgi:hypothetical protein